MLGRLHLEAFKCQRHATDAIWLGTDHRGELVATVEAEDFRVTVGLGVPGRFATPQPLTVRSLVFIEYLGVEDEDITVSFDEDGTSTVSVAGTKLSIDRPESAVDAPHISRMRVNGIAEVDAASLARLITAIDWAPAGVSGPVAEHPAVWLSCLDTGELVLSRDWSAQGFGRTTARTSVELTDHFAGPVHALTEAPYVMAALLHVIMDPDEMVAVDLGADRGRNIQFGTSRWTLRVCAASSASEQVINEAVKHLKTLDYTHERIDAATVVVGEYPNLVRIAASGQTTARIRCTQVLATGVGSSEQLLDELNQINLGLADTKIWLEDGSIVLGVDLENQQPESVAAAVDRLFERASQLGPALRSFAVSVVG